MTQLSNPIAVAQTQGSALNPLVSDCFSRVKWLCPPCHSPGYRHRRPGCLEPLRREPSHRSWPHTYYEGTEWIWKHQYTRVLMKCWKDCLQLFLWSAMSKLPIWPKMGSYTVLLSLSHRALKTNTQTQLAGVLVIIRYLLSFLKYLKYF